VLGDPGNGPMCGCASPECCALDLHGKYLVPVQDDEVAVVHKVVPVAAAVAMHHDYMLQRYAVLDAIDEADPHCPTCGGPAVVHVVGSSVYIRAPGVEPPPAAPHPAATGWQDGATE